MIRHYFKLNPDRLSDEDYYFLAAGAVWLEDRQAKVLARGIAMAFGEKG